MERRSTAAPAGPGLPWLRVAGCLAFLLAFRLPQVPFSDPAIRDASGGVGLFDIRPGLSPAEVAAALDALRPQAVERYEWFLAADLLFILLYTSTLAAVHAHLRIPRWLRPLPWLLAGVDLVEDALIAGLLGGALSATGPAAALLGPWTTGKFVLAAAALVLPAAAAPGRHRRRRPVSEGAPDDPGGRGRT